MTDKHHHHAIAPPLRGRPVPPYVRCIACSRSTRSRKFVQCTEDNSPGGRICLNCFESGPYDQSVLNCHSWVKSANSHAVDECGLCAIKTDQLIPCIVCDSSTCEACCNSATLSRFWATGAYETICNQCVPGDACADQNGLTTTFVGDRRCSWCIICQEWHESAVEGVVDCELDPSEHSPLARLCIERYAMEKAGNSKKSTKEGPVQPPANDMSEPVASKAPETARDMKRDAMLVDMQLQITEMEKRLTLQIEKSVNLKISNFEKNICVSDSNPTSLDKSSQVDIKDLSAAEALYNAYKMRSNPTQAIIDQLPKIIETITNKLERSYRFSPRNQNLNRNPKNFGNSRNKNNRPNGKKPTNGNPRQ